MSDGSTRKADVSVRDEVVEKPAASRKASSGPKVTNTAPHPVSVGGVDIAPGETADVPKLDANSPSIKRWVKAKIISVS